MASPNNIKILIIDGDLKMRSELSIAFQDNGFYVISAKDGVEGITLAEERRPDVILLDALLPKKDGFYVVGKIKELKISPIFIFLTNVADPNSISRALDMGVSDYIIKSETSINEIVKNVKNKLKIA